MDGLIKESESLMNLHHLFGIVASAILFSSVVCNGLLEIKIVDHIMTV